MNRPSLLPRQAKPRRAAFVLTPLIDVMFLLLIFFMLSSQISPYSLMPLGSVASGGAEGPAGQGAAPARDLSIRVSAGFVSIGGKNLAMVDLRPALDRFVVQGVTDFLVIPTSSATVQDIVTTLEDLQEASAEKVTLVNAARGMP